MLRLKKQKGWAHALFLTRMKWVISHVGLMLMVAGCLLNRARASDPLWEVMNTELNRCEFNPVNFQLRGEQLHRVGVELGNCDSLLVGEFLMRQAAATMGHAFDESYRVDSCVVKGSPLLFVLGFAHYNNDELEEAEHWWRLAAEAAEHESPVQLKAMLQALGVALLDQRKYQEALYVFEQAHSAQPENINPTEMNNLAYVSYVVGQCSDAVSWTELALEKIELLMSTTPEQGTVFINERNAILLTQLLAFMRMGDLEQAAGVVQAIRLPGPFDQRELAAAWSLSLYAQWADRKDWFRVVRPHLMALLEGASPDEIGMTLGANAALFEANWEEDWDRLRAIPVVFRGGMDLPCKSDASDAESPRASGAGWWQGALAALFILALVFALRMHLDLKSLREVRDAPQASLESAVDEAILHKDRWSKAIRNRAVVALGELMRRRLTKSLDTIPEFQQWSPVEQAVALGVANGEHTKSIAARLGVSVSHVYKVRHGLRNALELSVNDSLKKRLVELMAVLVMGWPMLATASPAADSLMSVLLSEDRAAWDSAIASGGWSGLEAPYDVAFLDSVDRPEWARVPDSVLWHWYQAAFVDLYFENQGAPSAVWSTNPTEAYQQALKDGKGSPWLWALLLPTAVLFGWGSVLRRRRGELLRVDGHADDVLFVGIESAERHVDSETAWRVFKSEPSTLQTADERLQLLSDSELEVAMYLAQHLTVEEIAQKLACTKGHVYNLRSSIRQKWELHPDDDLARTILRIQSGK